MTQEDIDRFLRHQKIVSELSPGFIDGSEQVDPDISGSDCDCCGTYLLGNRYAAVARCGPSEHVSELIEFSFCEDCYISLLGD